MLENSFVEVYRLIQSARVRVSKVVNSELIELYWSVGSYISDKIKSSEWGEHVVETLAQYLETEIPDLKGFNRRGLYRMKQFYETYYMDEIVSPLVSQISWTNHLLILAGAKTKEERQYYVLKSIKESYSKRELEKLELLALVGHKSLDLF